MFKVNEDNAEVDFINPEIAHITLKKRGVLSGHLLRELAVVSKVNHGSVVSGCIVSNNNITDLDTNACRICKKAERLNREMKMAVVCNATCLISGLSCPFASSDENKSPKIFSEFEEALNWISSKN